MESQTRYQLVDSQGSTVDIANKTFKMLGDDFTIELDLVERSFQSGADSPGVQRDESKELTFSYEIYYNNDSEFRAYQNAIMRDFRNTVKLKDILLSTETEVLYQDLSIKYDDGGQLRGAQITVTFAQLKPYWEDSSYTEATLTSITDDSIVVNYTGFIETPPVITITATVPVTKFSIKIDENSRGVIIKDPQFGSNGLTEFIIDNAAGTYLLNGVDRSSTVKQGTGPFNIILGTNTIEFLSSAAISVKLEYKKRYYI